MRIRGEGDDTQAAASPDAGDNPVERRRSLSFFAGGKEVVALLGGYLQQNFWMVDLTGERRQLTDLKPGYSIGSFDVSPDGRQILFGRVQRNSDVVLIELGRK